MHASRTTCDRLAAQLRQFECMTVSHREVGMKTHCLHARLESPFCDLGLLGFVYREDGGAKIDALESIGQVPQERGATIGLCVGKLEKLPWHRFQNACKEGMSIVFRDRCVRRADEDYARNGIDEELISIQLLICNAKCLLEDRASEAVADTDDGTVLVLTE